MFSRLFSIIMNCFKFLWTSDFLNACKTLVGFERWKGNLEIITSRFCISLWREQIHKIKTECRGPTIFLNMDI